MHLDPLPDLFEVLLVVLGKEEVVGAVASDFPFGLRDREGFKEGSLGRVTKQRKKQGQRWFAEHGGRDGL